MNKIHERRLLKAADIVEKAGRKFDISKYFHECGSPACVLGHYAAATRYRVFSRPSKYNPDSFPEAHFTLDKAAEHFGTSYTEACDIFGAAGCNNAKTGKQAAKYIRNFVKRKLEQSKP